MSKGKVFHGYVDGFEFVTASLAEMQAWIDRRKQDCKGKVLKLHQGIGAVDGWVFQSGMPVREAVL